MARLDEICSLNMGQSPDSSSYNEIGDGLPFFQGNADFGALHPRVRIWCNAPTKIAHSGDILISVRAPIGALNIADTECCIGRGLAALTVDETLCDRRYLWYAIANKVDELNSKGTGSTFKAISRNVLAETEIPLPSLEQQQQVSAVLDRLTSLIFLREQQLAKLDELVKARFVEMFSICEQRELIGNVVSISRGASPRPISEYITDDINGVNWIRIGDVPEHSLYIEHTGEKITLEGAKKSRYVHVGDFILSNSMSFGRPYILNIDGCVHDGWLIMSDYSKSFQPLYLYYAIRDYEVQSQFSRKVNGATVKNLNSDLVKNTLIKIPPMELQKQFSEFALSIEQTKLTIQKSLNKLEVLKESLMQEYFG